MRIAILLALVIVAIVMASAPTYALLHGSSYYSGMSQSWGGVYIRGFVSPPAYTYSQPAGALGYIRASGISYTRPVYTVQPGFRFYGTFPATRLPSAPASAYPLGAFWIRV